ncbi:MAG TPA: sigma 54-interacting transcriptional regulator, partial [Polyangiaceae bacterium]
DQRSFDPTPPPEVSFLLLVVDGSDAGARLTVDWGASGRVLVGTGPGCDLRLTDRTVSRRHAALELEGTSLRLEDLKSTNGTTVEGVRVREALLGGGESIRLGDTVLRIERDAGKPTVLPSRVSFGRLWGASREMRRLYPLCERLAAADVPVVIEGETGTGKEVLAESLHEAGARSKGPFVVFDCTATPSNLIESALFGHERGAFTGATGARVGVFEEAHGGTLLLDEIGDLDMAAQPKLLRAIERSEVRRVGGSRWIHVDVRVLAATRRDLDAEVEAGRFRDDLFHRLAVTRIELPPLRARRGDVALLTRELCKQMGAPSDAIPGELLSRWERAAWPGNVRELRNAVASYLALGDLARMGGAPEREDSPPGDPYQRVLDSGLSLAVARQRVVMEFERQYVERMLAKHGGNVSRAAEASGMARRNFQLLRVRTKG